ncbi:MAG TPA: hypothetical protein VM120_17830, partial [Bryobacteraceae bacterium]|nr:hypothetical protein [Bryobacteraceae bacterium]
WVYLTPGIEFGALFNQFGGSVSWFACHAPKLRSCKLENQATLPKAHGSSREAEPELLPKGPQVFFAHDKHLHSNSFTVADVCKQPPD